MSPAAAAPVPPSGYQERQVLARLRSGPLTPKEAAEELGVMRLAAVVYRLKGAGHPIAAESIEVPCRGGRSGRVARYHLTQGEAQ